MKAKFVRLFEFIVAMVIFGSIWFVYNTYFLVINFDGSKSLTTNGDPVSFWLLSAMTAIFSLTVVALIAYSFS